MSKQITLFAAAIVFLLCCQTLVFKASDSRMDGKLDRIIESSSRIETNTDDLKDLLAVRLSRDAISIVNEALNESP